MKANYKNNIRPTMPNYCRMNAFCLNENCRFPHYKSFTERQVIAKIMEENKEEMEKYLEPINPKIWNCQQHMLCYHNADDCKNNHSGYALEARKIVRKALKAHEKREKIAREIQAIKTKPMNWGDEC